MIHVNGIDVSAYQVGVDWSAVKAAGYSFGICKASEGVGETDDQFARNHVAEIRAHMVAGAYHYLSWHSDPVAQARHFLSVYRPQNGDLPPTLDCEACDVDPDTAIAQISGFLRTVEPHLGGARMLLYMSYSFPGDHLRGGYGFAGHPLYVAAYSNDAAAPVPSAWRSSMLWQYSDGQKKAAIAGVIGNVDHDYFLGSIDDLHAFTLRGIAS